MKVKLLFTALLLICSVILLTGCGNNIIPKTEFKINEQAVLDDINIKLNKVLFNENNLLEFVFEITNNRGNSITLVPDTSFVIYDSNNVKLSNIYINNNNIIKNKQTVNYTLQYNITDNKELYEIYFYSGIVENNIKFSIISSDISR